MKKFQFRLKTLLRMRHEEEEAARRDIYQAQRAYQKIQRFCEELDEEGRKIKERIQDLERAAFRSLEVVMCFQYLTVLQQKKVMQKKALWKAEMELDQRRKVVTNAMKRRKVIESFREKQYLLWEYEFQEKEKALFDEIATIRYARSRQNLNRMDNW